MLRLSLGVIGKTLLKHKSEMMKELIKKKATGVILK